MLRILTPILLLLSSVSYAQQPADCPKVTLEGPAGIVAPGDLAHYVVLVNPLPPAQQTTYLWSTSAGSIVAGQGTSEITVKQPAASITVTVEIKGLPAGCVNNISESTPWEWLLLPAKLDEFPGATDNEVKARVDNFFIQLNNNPTAQGYIINYGTPATIKKRKGQIMKAINFRKYDGMRITFVEALETATRIRTVFYLVPAGATPPKP